MKLIFEKNGTISLTDIDSVEHAILIEALTMYDRREPYLKEIKTGIKRVLVTPRLRD